MRYRNREKFANFAKEFFHQIIAITYCSNLTALTTSNDPLLIHTLEINYNVPCMCTRPCVFADH